MCEGEPFVRLFCGSVEYFDFMSDACEGVLRQRGIFDSI